MLRQDVKEAVLSMYEMLSAAGERQHTLGMVQDTGRRAEATSGRHLDPLANVIKSDLIKSGFRPEDLYTRSPKITIPGWYRRSKDWDLVAMNGPEDLVAAIELKSISSSFGNNSNNRAEESLGSATDALAAMRNELLGNIRTSTPVLGYVIIVKDCVASRKVGREKNALFPVDPVFADTNYLDRFRILCERLQADKLYQAVWLAYADPAHGTVTEPSPILTYDKFIATIKGVLEVHRA
ncbi:PaeR7I family type II restriction endonuclease [Bifidobacterium pseudolongum]|uniref:PaeR7I family type II restriction endonuclease n=1 Tax=Bifidobacterium pseudolongum TaxID=1694 RepID=UPI001FFDA170|nr:PaeR7I family type II restriction endonuclease [Bifidobacterium pseudolongum]MCI6531477.1 PaeR7I family type II restriction endonuclease [Bifidobacterium animalis]